MNSKITVILILLMTFVATLVAYELTLDKGLRSNNPIVRAAVLAAILEKPPEAEMGGSDLNIRMTLYDNNDAVAITAINVLKHRNIKEFNADLLILLSEGRATVRAACAKVLGDLGSKEEVTLPLWRSLTDDNQFVRNEAVSSIDRLHKTKLGFYFDQSPERYRIKAQEALREYLTIKKDADESHSKHNYKPEAKK
jgi:hypothetical protein